MALPISDGSHFDRNEIFTQGASAIPVALPGFRGMAFFMRDVYSMAINKAETG